MRKIDVAIVGASGLVGEKIIQILEEENLIENMNIALYVSNKSAGKEILIENKMHRLVFLDEGALERKFYIVFFSAGDEISSLWVPRFAEKGAFVIDNSNAFRHLEGVPLVIPEINIDKVSKNSKIIANPNCSTIELAIVINALSKIYEIRKIIVSTYQSVSGAGKGALSDLKNNTKFEIPQGICGNVIPRIGSLSENGFCTEENKIMFELNKILNKNYSICASTARVPIPYCHTESVYVKLTENVNLEDIKKELYKENIIFNEDIALSSELADKNEVAVCRLRKFSENEIAFFVVADNLRRGASYNAVLIAKHIINKFLN